MNSLTYLSRQFDALASSSNTTTPIPTTRPPEPTTWSLRSLVAPPPPTRRTLSIPATMPSLRASPSIRPKPQSTSRSIFRHLFFVRLLGLLWYALCAAVTSLRVDDLWHGGPRTIPHRPPRRKGALLEKDSSIDGKTAHMLQVGSDQAASHPESTAKSPHLSSSVLDPPCISTDPSAQDATYSSRPSHSCPPPQSFAAPMLTPPPSRTPTPTYSICAALPIAPRKSSFHLHKTLVLDLDETLIHSTTRPPTTSGIRGLFGARRAAPHTVDVVMGGRPNVYYVYKRPFVDLFLRKVRP